jgi:hypothetical protein
MDDEIEAEKPHFRPSEGVQFALGLYLASVGATGLEPVTPSVSIYAEMPMSLPFFS